ncbi:MAG: hypothetical protein B6D77_17685 [gamma proteobacterium symbiont of Ctena orbiculata]|nr:MAG: hypothetical protein B6D77_17685 [gamma proteobacterium symbiont of Ctena orbiculata]PVV20839.1 MAG: hypothetical protein B6D79_14300 [gamma proteobacterium symbiont of Ctena orbiculata]PVV24994.1 MAG: hypothetical protein B6D78_00835 [gamma proteobacterium symbiont of Ctena orbiculata]
MKQVFLVLVVSVAGCSDPVEVELFNYQGCRRQMTEEFIENGIDPVAANMQAKAYCEEQMEK